MKVLVIGRRGQLARSLTERALDRSTLELVTLGRPELDLEQPGRAAAAIATAAPDFVINAAAYTAVDRAEDEPERAFRINAEAAGEVAAAAAEAGAAIIQISTDYVFDGRAEGPYDETAIPHPASVYGESKLSGEERVRAANPRHAIIRTSWVYSPFGHNFVTSMMTGAGTRDPLTVVDDQQGSPTSALDLAEGLLRMVDQWGTRPELDHGGTYHLASTSAVSWCEFAQAIMAECRMLGLATAEVEPIPTEDWPTRAVRPRNSVLDSSRFAHHFGMVFPPWQSSLATVMRRLAQAASG